MAVSEDYASPACTKCGTALPIRMDESSGILNSDLSIECFNPNCRHINRFQGDLTVRRVGGRLQVIFQAMTAEQLHAVRDSLQALLKQPDATIETVAQSVEPTSSALATWIRTLNENQGVIALVGVLLTIIAMLLGNHTSSVNETINQTIIQIESGQTVNQPSFPRRQPCFCGRGKRYKNCCGRHTGADGGQGPTASRAAHIGFEIRVV
jgi:hypothetical protein